MKIKTIEAAKSLGVHPSHLLLHVAELDESLAFNEVWPEMDEGWVETVAATGKHRRPRPGSSGEQVGLCGRPESLSQQAVHVVDKLSRQGKWGNASVAFDALLNLTHVSKRDLEDVIDELRKGGLLDHDGRGRGTISLNPARRKDIERLTQEPPGMPGR